MKLTKKQQKIDGKAMALAAFSLWLNKAPKKNYQITHSKTTFVICSPKEIK